MNRTTTRPRGDISGGDESTGSVPNVQPDEFVNAVGSRAVFTCYTGKYKFLPLQCD